MFILSETSRFPFCHVLDEHQFSVCFSAAPLLLSAFGIGTYEDINLFYDKLIWVYLSTVSAGRNKLHFYEVFASG